MSEPTHEAASSLLTRFVDPEQLKKDLYVDPTNISKSLHEYSALLVFYGCQSARARRQYERYKTLQEILEGQLDKEHRAILKEENPKTTEAQIRSAVVLDIRWKAHAVRLIDAQEESRMADVAANGFKAQENMVLQIARDAGREKAVGSMSTGASIYTPGAAAASLSSAKERALEAIARRAATAEE